MGARLWLFLPTYNEAGNVEGIVRATAEQLERAAPANWRVLVVDDGSPDGTGEVADRLAAENERVEVLHRPGKEGLGNAYLAGFARALEGGAERVVVMDADFSHDPEHLPALIAEAESADLVLGSRYVDGGAIADWPPVRRLLSRWGSAYARRILGVKVGDLTTGFRCVRREVLEAVEPSTLRAQGYVFNIELTYRALLAGFRVAEIPITFRDRTEGDSKMSLPIAIEALLLVPKLRRLRRPARAGQRWRLPRWRGRAQSVLGSPGAESAGESDG
ncbi:MAG TPA: polyprenol monophosphomannose synthase [Solirubrobacteraceae bacterium]|nr:polyprenol monophosphomannose synthase [Solirubrobacteraceae bacterium]